jgi:peptidoglycan/xylan/chitin deacetylase (PgdA/CDA1 family)
MIRKIAKMALSPVLNIVSDVRRKSGRNNPVIVGYHNVVGDIENEGNGCMPSMLVSAETLERQIDKLARVYDIVNMDDAMREASEEGGKNRKPTAVISFDDGYEGVYRHAFGILRRKGVPFTLFTVTDPIGTNEILVHDRLFIMITRWMTAYSDPVHKLARLFPEKNIYGAHRAGLKSLSPSVMGITRAILTSYSQETTLKALRAMEADLGDPGPAVEGMRLLTWEMIREMHAAGVTIGSHSRSHAFLTNESLARVVDEVKGSKDALEAKLSAPVDFFAYPNGDYDSDIKKIVMQSGYKHAFTICGCHDGVQPMGSVPRGVLWEDSGKNAFGRLSTQLLTSEAEGSFEFASPCKRRH